MPEPLKNLYSRAYVERLADDCHAVHPQFERRYFVPDVFDRTWTTRELKDRMHHIAQCLKKHLPLPYPKAVRLLEKVAWQRRVIGGVNFTDMIFPDFVEQYGLEFPMESIRALERFTQTSSSEFAVRPFIVKYPEIMMQQMLKWTGHSSEHVRRLASEGCRPRLPWAMALPAFKKDPTPVLRILEKLKADPSEYVRRSVANNLNDISKDHPDLVIETTRRWLGKRQETDALIRHALRGLLKKGDHRALKLVGIGSPGELKVVHFSANPVKIRIEEKMTLALTLECRESTNVRVDYAVHFLTSTGKKSRKVFRWLEKTMNGRHTFEKSHDFRDRTVRKHFMGEHSVELIVNGGVMASQKFYLRTKKA